MKRKYSDTCFLLSELHDNMLLSILSFMTVKEAARMGVVSRRWSKLWSFTPTLDFDASETLRLLRHKPRQESEFLVAQARKKYVDWVNLVLNSHHKGSTLDQFRVQFDLNKDYACDIDTWLLFAIQNKVKHLTMDFYKYFRGWRGDDTYSFPTSFRGWHLEKLYLRCVNIDGAVVEHLISTCPDLEELAIIGSHSEHLVHLNIVGPSLSLKHLKIIFCRNLKSILVSATNLLSLEYRGRVIDITYDNVPNLVKVVMGGFDYHYYFPLLTSHLVRRLETLKLHLEPTHKKDLAARVKFPDLPYVKHLTLAVHSLTDLSILNYAALIEAAPSLCRIKIKMRHYSGFPTREVKKASKCRPLRRLKEIQVVGFEGHSMEIEFLEYLLENVVTLEKVIIGCFPPRLVDWPMTEDAYLKKELDDIRKRAMPYMDHYRSHYSLGNKLVLRNF